MSAASMSTHPLRVRLDASLPPGADAPSGVDLEALLCRAVPLTGRDALFVIDPPVDPIRVSGAAEPLEAILAEACAALLRLQPTGATVHLSTVVRGRRSRCRAGVRLQPHEPAGAPGAAALRAVLHGIALRWSRLGGTLEVTAQAAYLWLPCMGADAPSEHGTERSS